MISGRTLMLLLLAFAGGFNNRPHLHLQNLRVRDGQSIAAVAEHRVGFVQLCHARFT